MKTPIESWPRCPQTSLSKERHVIIENGQKLTAGKITFRKHRLAAQSSDASVPG